MPRLTVKRLFSDPPLSGSLPTDLRFSRGGSTVTYRAPGLDDRERMDLWQIDSQGQHKLWLDARMLQDESSGVADMTAEERAERERRRQFTHGINQYLWHPTQDTLLIPLSGQAYLCTFADGQPHSRSICPAGTRQSGFQFSPTGRFVSYVREGNLIYGSASEPIQEHQVTTDASATLNNGLADFLAAEEMHRFEGHWWSKDERYLAYCKVDEAPVAVSYRLELNAGQAQTIAQRYPYPGEQNPVVALHIYDLNTGTDTCIWRSPLDAAYLARVYAVDTGFVVLTQDRLQQKLDLQHYTPDSSRWQRIYSEQSTTWINLTNDFRALKCGGYLFSSEQSGTRKMMVLEETGHRVLPGPTHVNGVLGVDQHWVYVSGWHDLPTENHLFQISLNEPVWHQLTDEPGWHEVVLNPGCTEFIDTFSSESQPTSIVRRQIKSGPAEHIRTAVTQVLFEDRDKSRNNNQPHPYAAYADQHAVARFGQFEAADGQTLHYRLTPPVDISGQHPTIVYVYGGPGAQKVKREWSPLLLQLFAHHGFAVLEIDNRGSTNRGRNFEAPIYRNLSICEVQDQVAGLEILDNIAWTNPARVGVFGHSYGGYMALMCLCQAPEAFKAGVAAAPVCDWQLYDTHYTERYMGLPDDNPDGYRQANVLTHLEHLKAPLLLMHGMADDNVLFTHTTQIISKLQALGTHFDLMTYPGAKHSMQETHVSVHRFEMILSFFAKHL